MIFVLVVDSSNMFPIFVLDVGSSKVMFEDYRPYDCNNVSFSSLANNMVSVIPNANYSKLYIWTGTQDNLPTQRYKNVIYIITDASETTLPEYTGE